MNNLNEQLFNSIFQLAHRSPILDAIGIFLANGVIYLLGVASVFIIFSLKGWRKKMILFIEIALACILSRGIVAEVIRFFYPQPRPFIFFDFPPLISSNGNSFPSGHTIVLFALATVIFLFNKKWGFWFLLLSAVSGVARVFVGVHWPFDIFGGILFGVLSALFVHVLMKPYLNELKMKSSERISNQ